MENNLASPIDIIRESLEIYFKKDNLIYLTKYALLQIFSFVIIIFLPFVAFLPSLRLLTVAGSEPAISPMMWVTGGVLIFLTILANIWLYIATTYAIFQVIEGKILGVRQTLEDSLKRVLPFVLYAIMLGLILVVGFVLFIIPGIIFLVWFYFSQYFVIVEGVGPIGALKKSKELSDGRFWGIMGRGLAIFIFLMLVNWIATLILSVIGTLIISLATPYFYVPQIVLYKKLKPIASN